MLNCLLVRIRIIATAFCFSLVESKLSHENRKAPLAQAAHTVANGGVCSHSTDGFRDCVHDAALLGSSHDLLKASDRLIQAHERYLLFLCIAAAAAFTPH